MGSPHRSTAAPACKVGRICWFAGLLTQASVFGLRAYARITPSQQFGPPGYLTAARIALLWKGEVGWACSDLMHWPSEQS